MVLSRAVVRDMYPPMRNPPAMIGYVTMGMSLVIPMIGPMIGGLLDELYGLERQLRPFLH